MKKIIVFLHLITVLCLGETSEIHKYSRVFLSHNALSLLNDPVKVKTKKNLLPDASFIFMDVKCFIPDDCDINKSRLKVCELGSALYAGRPDSPQIINGKSQKIKSPYWEFLWHYLYQFNLPIWCVGNRQRVAYDALLRNRGFWYPTLAMLERSAWFKRYVANIYKDSMNKRRWISDYKGIIVFTGRRASKTYLDFKERYPGFLYINNQTAEFLSRKDLINQVFESPELKQYKPQWKVYKKGFSQDLVNQIKKDFAKCDFLMIKPIKSMQSRGVSMIRLDQLADRLRLIFHDTHLLKEKKHRAYQHWLVDKNPNFIIEEYAASKTIYMDGKPYDPTMRIVVLVSQEKGMITLHVTGGFWKIPLLSLEDEGTLTEKHVTIPFAGSQYVGIPIDPQDMEVVRAMVGDMFGKAYERMLMFS